MPLLRRVLDPHPCGSLVQYEHQGGGRGLARARRLGPSGIIAEITAAGLRGRGGAGFRAGVKWQTVADSASRTAGTSVVVNGAEGEPGTFKDRTLLRCNPYKVLEGALIAAVAVDAAEIVVGLKHVFEREIAEVSRAIVELREAGWTDDLRVRVVEGPSSYLFGEETALLEVVEGRQPFPRVDPPYRRGLDPLHRDSGHSAARVHLAAIGGTDSPPALVNNVETMANVPGILEHGPDWYRAIGTDESPGSLLCTITGHTRRHAVGEVPMGTTVREAIALIGGGPRAGRQVLAVLSGVANPILPAALLDTPLSFEALARVGSGLGAGGLIVFQDGTDLLDVAHAVARFLAVESCGQCEPCKRDGLAIADVLATIISGRGSDRVERELVGRLETVTRGARCALATQQEQVIASIVELLDGPLGGSDPRGDGAALLLPVVDIIEGRAVLDTAQDTKNPDWTYSQRDSGSWPAARLGNAPVQIGPARVREDLTASRMASVAVPVTGPRHPLASLAHAHDSLLADLRAATEAPPAERARSLRALASKLLVHVDVTRRVLYPMVRRVAGTEGDASSADGSRSELAGLRLVEEMERSSSLVATDDDALQQLEQHLRAHIEAERDRVIPLLVASLDHEALDALENALNEARLRAQDVHGLEASRTRAALEANLGEAS
ncbi:MAG TPA: NADH-ubiquinone oxidoreductase-F iron-sulfur binding region domain-containing protein [Acidimicrobiales bacterium]|nr:NADH-ubiquinone oxidoreductase-F iron-sulfur binding region domain-containing protein [Acidimicrobiales bacterium]